MSANDEEEGPRGAGKGKGVGRGKGKGKGGKRGPPTTYAASENSEQEDYQASDADGAESASDEGNGGEGLSGYQQQQDDQGSEDFDGDSVDQQDAREADGRGGGAEVRRTDEVVEGSRLTQCRSIPVAQLRLKDAGPDPYGNQPYYSESEDQDDAYDEDEEFAEIPDRAPVYEEPEPGDDNADDEEEAEQDEEEDYLTGDGGEQSRSFIGGKGRHSA